MLCVVLRGPSLDQAEKQMQANSPYADLFEWRLDAFAPFTFEALQLLLKKSPKPSIFTLRPKAEGGFFQGSECSRLCFIEHLASLKPAFLDLEHTVPTSYIAKLKQQHPEVKIILSYHHWQDTDLSSHPVLDLLGSARADFYKIAIAARTNLDPLRLLQTIHHHRGSHQLIGVSMGEKGQMSRIISPLIGNCWTYASCDEGLTLAPGQLSAYTLATKYHYPSLNSTTALYGLIGNPIDKSISDVTHNAVFAALHLSAVYVKMTIESHELALFLDLACKLGFAGLSVTMPLKEAIVPYLSALDPFAQQIGAVNTLAFEDGHLIGYNTDGKGALQAIEERMDVYGKTMVLIGAGGAAKAIACEACQRGCRVIMLNRHEKRARRFAEELGCEAGGLEQMQTHSRDGYDILINCSPHPLPIDPEYLCPGAVIMDISTAWNPPPLLIQAQIKGCAVISGYRMFVYQALGQFEIWFKNRIDLKIARVMLDGMIPASV